MGRATVPGGGSDGPGRGNVLHLSSRRARGDAGGPPLRAPPVARVPAPPADRPASAFSPAPRIWTPVRRPPTDLEAVPPAPSPTPSLAETSLGAYGHFSGPVSPATTPPCSPSRTATPGIASQQPTPAGTPSDPDVPAEASGPPELRRSQRTTFGQHHNPFHLPRSALSPPLPPADEAAEALVVETATIQGGGECDRPASAGQSDDVTDPQACRSPPPGGGRGPPETGSSASTGSTIPPAYLNPSGPGLERVAPQPPGQEEVYTAPLIASQWAADELSGGKRRCMRSDMPGVRTQLGCVWDHVYRRL